MDRESIQWVINLCKLEACGGTKVDKAADDRNEKCRPIGDISARGCDGHQASKDTIAHSSHIIALQLSKLEQEHSDSSRGRCNGGVHGNMRGQPSCGRVCKSQGGATVEAVPTKPKDECSEHQEWNIVRCKLVFFACIEPAQARSQHNGPAKCTNATCHVDNATPCKVIVANVSDGIFTTIEPASTAPSPIYNDWVDNGCQPHRVDGISVEVDALSDTSTDNGCSSTTECPLEEPPQREIGWRVGSIVTDFLEEAVTEVLLGATERVWVLICAICKHPTE
mmetsp:Transcript_43436/g.97833  ORF Transcript_43436/g.97833 Transcript_43436/m.97833 type:complete len:280 (-) Transcript_43436:561-1400(-)